MTDEQALLRNVLAAPEDDLPRLVYADWLEEHADDPCEAVGPHHGDRCDGGRVQAPNAQFTRDCPACSGTGRVPDGRRKRAEFIRVQCELARPVRDDHEFKWAMDKAADALRRRERELLDDNWSRWIRGMGLVPDGWKLSTDGESFHVWRDGPFDDGFRFEFRRGFVEQVRAPLAVLFGGPCGRENAYWFGARHVINNPRPRRNSSAIVLCPDCSGTGTTPGVAAALWRSQPVTRVVLTDRDEPHWNGRGYAWYRTGRTRPSPDVPAAAELPADLFGDSEHPDVVRFEAFETADDARRWLSGRCVAHGRELAGLT